jgi:hypothetical protein
MTDTPMSDSLRDTVTGDPDAFYLVKMGSDNMGDWRVRSGKYGIDESFLDFSRQAGIYPFKLHCILVHQTGAFLIDGTSYPATSVEDLDIDHNRGEVRRSFRGLDGVAIEIIRERLDLSSDAEAVREAVRIVARKLTKP